MDNIATNVAEIELYKDIVKIGIPALLGLFSGLIPFFLEKNKLKESTLKEKQEFRNKQVIELIECFSIFSGNLSAYLTIIFKSKE
jgi:hypothetical protein